VNTAFFISFKKRPVCAALLCFSGVFKKVGLQLGNAATGHCVSVKLPLTLIILPKKERLVTKAMRFFATRVFFKTLKQLFFRLMRLLRC
jgi:hypothetical protein